MLVDQAKALAAERGFKSAEDLGISEEERRALVLTIIALESGEIKKLGEHFLEVTPAIMNGQTFFNMNFWLMKVNARDRHCGSVGCIGGLAEVIGLVEFKYKEEDWDCSLNHLFYPRLNGWDAGVGEAAIAIDHFLKTGKPPEEW